METPLVVLGPPAMEPSKERRIVGTIDAVCADLDALANVMLHDMDRATQEAMIVSDVRSGQDLLYPAALEMDESPPLSAAAHLASLGAPQSSLLQGFEDLPENFLESSAPDAPTTITLGASSSLAALTPVPAQRPSRPSATATPQYILKLEPSADATAVDGEVVISSEPSTSNLPILVAQNGLQYVKVELGGKSSSGLAVSQAQHLIQSMLEGRAKGGAGGRLADTITVTPTRDAEGRLVMRPHLSQAPKAAPPMTLVDEEGEDIYIETRDLCKRIAYELKHHSIPQAVFAEKVLCRSQGTLSDLLRNPKPWNKLKSGRETFRRMYAWLKQPLTQRLQALELWKEADAAAAEATRPPPRNKLEAMEEALKREEEEEEEMAAAVSDSGLCSPPRFPPLPRGGHASKRPRLVFTDIQKRTLQAIFKETQRPSKEMQQTISEHLGLDLSTVQNFFMNARRRFRIGPTPDGPAPNQLLRPITPPPSSPTAAAVVGRPPKKRPLLLDTGAGEEEVYSDTYRSLLETDGLHKTPTIFQGGSDGIVATLEDPGAPTPPAYSLESPVGSPGGALPGVGEVLPPPPSTTGLSPKKRFLIDFESAAKASGAS